MELIKKPLYKHKIKTLYDLYKLSQQDKVIFNEEYQRSAVWPVSKKQYLLDSIIRGYDISSIFLRQLDDGVLECLDGQQRLRSLFEFLDNNYTISSKITSEFPEKPYFTDLDDELQNYIKKYDINCIIFFDIDEETTSDIFLRLQEGMPLNSPEKLNAIRSKLRLVIINLAKHPFFSKSGISNRRFSHRYLAAQILAIEFNGDMKSDTFHIGLIKKPDLVELYNRHKSEIPDTIKISIITSTLDSIMNVFGQHWPAMKFKADLLSFYIFYRFLHQNYSFKETGTLASFLLEFLRLVQERQSLSPLSNDLYKKYALLRSTSSDSPVSIQERLQIMMSKFFEHVGDLTPKDSRRSFNHSERFTLYLKANGKCEIGQEDTDFSVGEADHITPYSKGGKTVISNGRWLCKDCHNKVHST